MILTMRSGNLAPDYPDLSSPLLCVAPVNISDLLAEVEAAMTSQ